jgi:hypothetical protein
MQETHIKRINMDAKSKLLIIKEACSKALSMSIKESYISNLYVLEKECPSNTELNKLVLAIQEKCDNDCNNEEITPEILSQEILGYDIFFLDRYQIFTISYVFVQKIINDIFNEFIFTDNELFRKTAYLREVIDNAFAVDKNCKNQFNNKRYYSALFKDFLDSRKVWYNKVNEEIDLIISEL